MSKIKENGISSSMENLQSAGFEDFVREVLDTRPAIRATERPVGAPIERGITIRRSLPTNTKQRDINIRRTSSLYTSPNRKIVPATGDVPSPSPEGTAPNTDIIIADIEGDDQQLQPAVSFQRDDQLRRSSAPLRRRLVAHRQRTLRYNDRGVKTTWWGYIRYVRWPKIKNRLQILRSYELWKNHLKEVEGHFGTAVVSYFVFLRWIFIMNLIIFFLWFGIICIPQIVHQIAFPPNTTSNIACLINSITINSTCSNESMIRTNGSLILYSIPSNCSSEPNVIMIQECAFNEIGTAFSENGNIKEVSEFLYDHNCNIVPSTNQNALANVTEYEMCIGVQPFVEWYQHILNFISGSGIFNETLLFQGVYPSTIFDRYDFSLAFLFMTALVYIVGVILLIYKMGHAFNESYVNFSTKRQVNFCNKLFTAWDFNITEASTAELRKTHIRIEFQEELMDLQAREKKWSGKKLALVIFTRIVTNALVLLILAGAGAAIFYSALYEFNLLTTGVVIPFISEYVSAIVISVLNAVLPLIFDLIARLEQYKTRSGAVKITLLRTIVIRLSSLIVLLASIYLIIGNCVQPVVSSDDQCTITSFAVSTIFNDNIGTINETCPTCWETFIGQNFYKLGVTNLFISVAFTLLIETGRHISSRIAVRIKWKNLGHKLGRIITKGNFNISKSILDLIYTQTLLWLGFLFSPILPFIVLINSLLIFYIKKYSLIWNLEPDKKGFQRSARTNFLFLFLMLLALFVSIVPVLYAVLQLQPSVACGPFREQTSMFQSVSNLIDNAACGVRIATDFFFSAAFAVPLIIFLILLSYALYVVLKARNARFNLIKKQLILEGANVTHIVGNLNMALQQLQENGQPNQELADDIQRRSRLLQSFTVANTSL